MFSPSANVLINRVDIYRGTNATDVDGGFTPTYSLVRRSVACSVQFEETGEDVTEENGRLTQVNRYAILFGFNPNVKPRDKMVWTDNLGTKRTLFVQASEDCAGRAAAFMVKAVERI